MNFAMVLLLAVPYHNLVHLVRLICTHQFLKKHLPIISLLLREELLDFGVELSRNQERVLRKQVLSLLDERKGVK